MTATVDAISANIIQDPFMDAVVIGLPVYFWVMFGMLVVIIVFNLFWWYRRSIMYPVIGYNTALKYGKPLTLFLNKNKAFFIEYLENIDSVLSFKDVSKVSKWLIQSPESIGRLGGLRAILVRDNFDYTVDPVAEIAICVLAENWNKKYGKTQPLNSYKDFAKLRDSGALEAEYPNGVEIPVYNIYDPSLIQKYLPVGRSSAMFGANLISRANDLRKDRTQEGKWAKYVPIAVIITICVVMLCLAYTYGTGGI